MPTRIAILIVTLGVLNAAVSVGMVEPPPFVHEPAESYEERDLHGFRVLVSAAARANPDTTDPALRVLEAQLAGVVGVIPSKALETLRTVPIWVEHMNPDRPCACYHVSARWLTANGYIADKARSVEISNPVNFVRWVQRTQPWMTLHELAHGYHDIVFGYGDASIRATFEKARDAGLYQEVPYIHGGTQRHYALTNQMEYFAELTESYFGKNDFYPFTRGELREYDPDGYAMIERCWGVREGRAVGEAATGQGAPALPKGFERRWGVPVRRSAR